MSATAYPGANLPQMGVFNETVVLDAIRRSGAGLTRAQLARRTGLSAQTITNIARRLLDNGMVMESGARGTSGPGRHGTVLELNAASRYAIGLSIDPATAGIVLLDLAGGLVEALSWPMPTSGDAGEALGSLSRHIEELLDRRTIRRAHVVGVGVACPGPIDHERGVALNPPLLPLWRDVPIRDAISRATGLPTLLDKDVNAAMASYLYRPGLGEDASGTRRPSDALFCWIGTGVAVSVAINGQVLRGASGNAGESGHLPVDSAGPLCSCGKHGCLGTLLGSEPLVRAAQLAGVPGLSHVDVDDSVALDDAFTALCRAARGGCGPANDVLASAGRWVARAGGILADLLDLDVVVVGGPLWDRMAPFARPALLEAAAAHVLPRGDTSLNVLESPFGPEVAAVGAASMVLGSSYSPSPGQLLLAV